MNGKTRERDHVLDAMRGVCLLSMIFLHLAQGTWPVRFSLGRTIGFFSGADGFFFLSGLVFGKVYARRLAEQGAKAGVAVMRRVARIYAYHLGTLVCLLAAALLFPREVCGISSTYQLAVDAPWSVLWRGALFIYQPRFLDILPLYVVYLPMAWLILLKGWERTPWLPLAALSLWATQQFHQTAFGAAIFPGAFNFVSYLALFLLGLAQAQKSETPREQRTLAPATILATGVAIACFLVSHPRLLPVSSRTVDILVAVTSSWTEKYAIGWLRLADFVAAATVVAWARPWLPKLPVMVLASLGKRSLGVFTAHILWFLLLSWPEIHLRSTHQLGYGTFLFLSASIATAVLWMWDRQLQPARNVLPHGAMTRSVD
jgi:hypothetical protein